MSENKIGQSHDDDISLVDLFVVLLKYRRLILAVTLLGVIAGGLFYILKRGEAPRAARQGAALTVGYEGRMAAAVNPRLGKSGVDRIPGWFGSRELLETSLKEAGLSGKAEDLLTVTYNQNDGVEIYFRPGFAERGQIENTFSILLKNAEALAVGYYRRYAEDLVSWFESSSFAGERSGVDYVRYRWAKDLLAGDDTVLVALYPPLVSEAPASVLGGTSPLTIGIVIVFASLMLAVFLAFAINAFKNMGADNEVRSKIRGALEKTPRR